LVAGNLGSPTTEIWHSKLKLRAKAPKNGWLEVTTLKVLISGRPICRGELLVSERVPFFFGKKRILPNVFENKKLGGGRNGFPFWGSPFFV